MSCPPPGDLPNPGTEGRSPTLQAYSLPVELPGKPHESLRQRNQVLVSHVSTILKQAIFKIRIVPTIPPLVRNTGELEFSWQEYWSGLPVPSPGHFPDPVIEPRSLALQTDSLSSGPPGKILLIANKLSYFLISLFPLMLIYTHL